MMRLRHIVQSAFCCLLCLTVCVVPALAGNEQYTDGFIYWESGGYVNATLGSETVNLLDGYFPASISADSAETLNDNYRNFEVVGKPYTFATKGFPVYKIPQMYVEVLFGVPAPLTVAVSGVSSTANPTCGGSLEALYWDSVGGPNTVSTAWDANSVDWVVDNSYSSLSKGNFDVKRYFGFRYSFNAQSVGTGSSRKIWGLGLHSDFNGKLTFSDPNYVEGIFNEVTVNTGVLQEINGKLTEIQTSTTQIQTDVSEIKNGLQDSNSSIWQSFKDSVSGLFVPSSAELETVKNGFDQLAQEKLGGAYQTVDLVDDGVKSVVNKIKNPGDSPGVEFPGISVPLGGDVGTVTLAASQTVTIPEQITNVLYPVAGVIIPIVCVIWTIRQCTDMVECFMSGMSYAEFLHRNSDKEDDEV